MQHAADPYCDSEDLGAVLRYYAYAAVYTDDNRTLSVKMMCNLEIEALRQLCC